MEGLCARPRFDNRQAGLGAGAHRSKGLGGGLLSTNGGIVFSGELNGEFVALDAATGKPVWHFNTGEPINAQPMTYMVGGKQYVAIATNTDVFGFALFEPEKVTSK
jgi:alcohol dehydrogenase (cytochrome c)